MAIGIPKGSNSAKAASARLEYEKKRPISSILETPSPAVCTLHTASSIGLTQFLKLWDNMSYENFNFLPL